MSNDLLSFEFLTQLEASLGVDGQTALATLGDWLVSYEPVTRRRLESLGDPEPASADQPNFRRVA